MKTLKINSTNGKLNLLDLPHNCLFNKKITGCGGTTIALFNDENYVIVVPTTELIVNKTGRSEAGISTITNYDGKQQTVIGLFDTFSYYLKKQLKEYLSTDGVKKIICTYDKVNALTKLIDPSQFRILIDEYQVLLKSFSYRKKAVNGVLNNFRLYKSHCFMSATPINPDFKPSSLDNIEEVVAEWNEVDTLRVVLDETKYPFQKAANIITSFKDSNYAMALNGVVTNELFFFINSVSDIASIMQYCELTNDEVKIVCADTDSNRSKLNGYTISNSKADNKPVTFITSKSFEGADYFSETGASFVVSNSSKQQTLLDISTDIYQIAGRIRTESNPNRNTLIHIFNTTGKGKLNLDISYEEMVSLVNKKIKGTKQLLELANNDEAAALAAEKVFNDDYIIKDEDGKYSLNDTLIKLELFNYSINQEIYKNGISLTKAYNKTGAEVFETNPDNEIENQLVKAGTKLTFKEAFLKYAEIKGNPYDMTDTSYLEKVQPLIVKAYSELGEKKVRELKYIKKNVEAALLNADEDKNTENKIAKLLKSEISTGFISRRDIKAIFTKVYERLGISKAAKATDIERYYECKDTSKRVDGIKLTGYDVYRCKLIFSE